MAGFSQLRRNDRSDPSSGTTWSREPEETFQTLGQQPEDGRKVEKRGSVADFTNVNC